MKTFIQTIVIPEFVIPANVLEKRWWPTWTEPYASFFYEWAAKGYYTEAPHPEDYRIEFSTGQHALGYYWGDESMVPKAEEYLAAKKLLPEQTYFIKQEIIVCADHEHPTTTHLLQNFPVANYSLADNPTFVYTNPV